MVAVKAVDLNPKFRDKIAEILENYDFNNCLACGMCTAGCPYTDLLNNHDPRKFIRKVLLGMQEAVYADPYMWTCNMCDHCTVECPMGVSIADLVQAIRSTMNKEQIIEHLQDMDKERTASGDLPSTGLVAWVDINKCAACLTCVRLCPAEAVQITKGAADINPVICKGCGVCAGECPNKTITLLGYNEMMLNNIDNIIEGWFI